MNVFGLGIAFIKTIGFPRRTAHNYIQAYERLRERMKDFSYLGVTKLLTVTRIKEPVPYLEKDAEVITVEATDELRRIIDEETKKRATGRSSKKPGELPLRKMNLRLPKHPDNLLNCKPLPLHD